MEQGKMKYCPQCSHLLAPKEIRGRERLACDACGYVFYNNPTPVVAAIVEREAMVLSKKTNGRRGMADLKSYIAQADHVGTGLVLRQSDGRFVFAISKPAYWETRHGKLYISFEAVGGGVEAGETLIDCAKREAREEASCEIQLHSAVRTYLRTAEGKLSVVSVDDKPTPLALYEKIFPHPPDHPELRRPSKLLIVIYLAECLGDPRPSREIPALLVMKSEQYQQAIQEIPLAQLLAAGAELIEAQHIPRDAIISSSFGTADLLAQVLRAERRQEALSLFPNEAPGGKP